MKELSTIAGRLSLFLQWKGLSEQAFRKRVGWSQGLLGKAVREGRALGGDKLENVLREFSDLSPAWLMLGEGEMLREGIAKKDGRLGPNPSGMEGNIIALSSKAAAGLLKHRGQAEFLDKQPRMSLPGYRFRGGGLLAIQITGDSMEPTILDGDWLVVKRCDDPRQQVRPGYIYVVVTREGATAKRLRVDLASEVIVCESDNPDHPAFTIDDRDAAVYDVLALVRENPGDQRHSFNARLVRLEQSMKEGKE